LKHLPLFHDITQSRWLIVGGGTVASRRAHLVASAGGRFDLVALTASDTIVALCQQCNGKTSIRAWQPSDLTGDYQFVIAATDDAEANRQIAEKCKSKHIAVNVATDANLCDFTFPATINGRGIQRKRLSNSCTTS